MAGEEKSGQYSRGLRAFKSGDYQAAVELLSEAVEFDENNDRAWNALGTACAKVGRYEDADLCFSNAITISPDNPVYQKNQRTNAKHLKVPPQITNNTSSSILDRLPLSSLHMDKQYLLAGGAIIGIIILCIILLVVVPFFNTPAHPSEPPLQFSVNLSGSSVTIMNEGGQDIEKITSLIWKVNDIQGNTLNKEKGSTAQISLKELSTTNLSAGLRVIAVATYHDGNQMLVLDQTLPPPSPDAIPTESVSPAPTPTLPPDVPHYQAGEVLFNEHTGEWWIINSTPSNGSYVLTHAARLPDGSFTNLGSTITNISYKTAEQNTRSIGTRGSGGTPIGLSAMTPPPVSEVSTLHPDPKYPPGDLVNSGSSDQKEMLVILGYDPVTDQYQADTIYQYYTGEWGYRINNIPKWFIRPVLENQYSVRSGRITLSDVGIGADSAPPRTPVKYSIGDIISPQPSGVDHTSVILDYNKTDDQYRVDTISPAYNGGWKLEGHDKWEKRVFVERDNPYYMRKIDLSLISTG